MVGSGRPKLLVLSIEDRACFRLSSGNKLKRVYSIVKEYRTYWNRLKGFE